MKRRKLLINPKFQLVVVAHVYATMGIVMAALSYPAFHAFAKLRKLAETGGTCSLAMGHIIDQQQRSFGAFLTVMSIACIAGVGLVGLTLSHRITGPLYRLKRHFLDLAQGKPLRPVKLREHDFHQDLADAVNEFIRHAQKKEEPESRKPAA